MPSAYRLKSDIPVILTGTIIPNAPNTAYADPSVRRREYLIAIKYYSKFSQVVFLENSTYPLEEDAEFQGLANVQIVKMPVSNNFEKGKGYQEFEMMDNWICNQDYPPKRWIKITGRYYYNNFHDLYRDCQINTQTRIIIDLCPLSKRARTYIFCVDTDFYMQYIQGAFRKCSDANGFWIEEIIYKTLCRLNKEKISTFSIDPDLIAVSGSTGITFHASGYKKYLRSTLRKINRLVDEKYLWYTK